MRICVATAAVLAAGTAGAQCLITNFDQHGQSVVHLTWNQPTNRFVIERGNSMFDFPSNTLGVASSSNILENSRQLPMTGDSGFYRVKLGLQAIDVPDPAMEIQVRANISSKAFPTNLVYDTDVNMLGSFSGGYSVTNLRGIEQFVSATNITFQSSSLASLSFVSNSMIDRVNLWGDTNLTSVALPAGKVLNWVTLGSTKLSAVPGLGGATTRVDANGDALTSVSLSGCTNMSYFDVNNCSLGNIDFSPCIGLKHLEASGDGLTNVVLTGCTNLQSGVFLDRNSIRNIKMPRCLTPQLWCGQNSLTNLDVRDCKFMVVLDCHSNSLQRLDISSSISCTYIDARWNPLTNICVWWNPPGPTWPTVTLLYDGSPTFTWAPPMP